MTICLKSIPHLVFKPFAVPGIKGVQAVYKNWSVICHEGSYGYNQDLYEVMGPGFDKDYGVEGYLTLGEIIIRIAEYEADNED